MLPGSFRMPFALIAELRGLGLNADQTAIYINSWVLRELHINRHKSWGIGSISAPETEVKPQSGSALRWADTFATRYERYFRQKLGKKDQQGIRCIRKDLEKIS